jgi:hypothetical protein
LTLRPKRRLVRLVLKKTGAEKSRWTGLGKGLAQRGLFA